MKRFVTLGEVLLRFKSPGRERLLQSGAFEAGFGGAEANVAVSLANLGLPAAFVSAVPANPLGDAAIAELRRHGVDVGGVIRSGERLGLYFLEAGAGSRPARVVYDRAGSALATISATAFDWDAIFSDAGWLHVTGITPALGESAAALTLAACREAKTRGLTVSCDLNHRRTLWRYGKSAPEVMPAIFALVDIGIGGREDCQHMLGIGVDDANGAATPAPGDTLHAHEDATALEQLTGEVLRAYPNLRALALTLRASTDVDRQVYSACLARRGEFVVGPRYELGAIVDPIGAGDAFAAGLIYGLHRGFDAGATLAFASAAGALKHSIPGDFNRVSVAEIEQLVAGAGFGRVQR